MRHARRGSIIGDALSPSGPVEELARAYLARADAARDPDDEARWVAAALEWLRLAAAARDPIAVDADSSIGR
jgi:hypothetical protein